MIAIHIKDQFPGMVVGEQSGRSPGGTHPIGRGIAGRQET